VLPSWPLVCVLPLDPSCLVPLSVAKNKPSATCLWLQLLSDAQNSTGLGFPGGAVVKNPPANAGDTRDAGLIPGSRRSPGEGNGHPSRIPWTEEPGGYSPRGHKESDAIERLSTHACHSLTHNVPLSVHPSSCSWMILRILQFSAQRSPLPLSTCALNPAPGVMDVMRICCRQLLLRHAFPRCAHPVWSGPVLDVC